MHCERFICILRIIGTTLFGVSLLLGITAAYIVGYQFIQTDNYYFSFGLYGAILALHLLIQSLFAYLEHRKMKRSLETPIKLNKSVALCIAAYQEDPDYLRKCLLSVKRLTYPGMKIIMVIDGNSDDDIYMMDTFREIMGNDLSATYIWKNNFHQKGPGETEQSHKESMQHVTQLVLSNRYICIMQKWGGKREVMYTAFNALGRSVDYVQVGHKSMHVQTEGPLYKASRKLQDTAGSFEHSGPFTMFKTLCYMKVFFFINLVQTVNCIERA